MTDPIESPQTPEDEAQGWTEQPEEVTVLAVPESSLPKAAVPARRRGVDARGKVESGLRIEPRDFAPSSDPEEGPAEPSELVINRIGEGVVRLESGKAEKAEPQETPRPVMQKREARQKTRDEELGESWGQAKKHSHRWMFWGGAGVLVAVVGGWSAQSFLSQKSESNAKPSGYATMEVVNDVVPEENITAYFSENAGEIDQQMRMAMAEYARARSVEEVVPFVRNGAALRARLAKEWKPLNAPKGWAPASEAITGYTSIGKLPYGTMNGMGPDYAPFQTFFVREGNRMVVDWEASSARCEPPFARLEDRSVKEAVVRVIVGPTTYHNVSFPESDFAAYRLGYPGSDSLVWGYVRRGTPAAATLDEMFSPGAILMDQKGEQTVRLRIARGPEGAMANQWLVLDVLHKGWVTP